LSRGALAAIGHVERAWGYSFLSPSAGAQTGVFEGTLLQLFSGDPVGWTTENLNMKYADLAAELTSILEELDYDPNYINPYDLAAKWTAHNDSRSYVVIGDPAVRLPIAMPDESPAERPSLGTISIPEGESKPKPAAPAPKPAPAPTTESEEPGAGESFDVAFGLRDQFSGLTDSLKEFTEKLADALGKAAEDILTLEVETYTTEDIGAVTQGDKGKAQLRAYTRIAFDGDMEVYVPEKSGGGVDKELWQVHLDTVGEAQRNRAQFMQAMAEMATNLLKSLKP
jgi:hypothetical protein